MMRWIIEIKNFSFSLSRTPQVHQKKHLIHSHTLVENEWRMLNNRISDSYKVKEWRFFTSLLFFSVMLEKRETGNTSASNPSNSYRKTWVHKCCLFFHFFFFFFLFSFQFKDHILGILPMLLLFFWAPFYPSFNYWHRFGPHLKRREKKRRRVTWARERSSIGQTYTSHTYTRRWWSDLGDPKKEGKFREREKKRETIVTVSLVYLFGRSLG